MSDLQKEFRNELKVSMRESSECQVGGYNMNSCAFSGVIIPLLFSRNLSSLSRSFTFYLSFVCWSLLLCNHDANKCYAITFSYILFLYNKVISKLQSKQWSFHSRTNKNLEKVKKKMVENQAALIKASPCLTFKIHDRRLGRIHTLLMASDYERANWRTTICGLLSRGNNSRRASEISKLLIARLLRFGCHRVLL